jgi:hypothetical protein
MKNEKSKKAECNVIFGKSFTQENVDITQA